MSKHDVLCKDAQKINLSLFLHYRVNEGPLGRSHLDQPPITRALLENIIFRCFFFFFLRYQHFVDFVILAPACCDYYYYISNKSLYELSLCFRKHRASECKNFI